MLVDAFVQLKGVASVTAAIGAPTEVAGMLSTSWRGQALGRAVNIDASNPHCIGIAARKFGEDRPAPYGRRALPPTRTLV